MAANDFDYSFDNNRTAHEGIATDTFASIISGLLNSGGVTRQLNVAFPQRTIISVYGP